MMALRNTFDLMNFLTQISAARPSSLLDFVQNLGGPSTYSDEATELTVSRNYFAFARNVDNGCGRELQTMPRMHNEIESALAFTPQRLCGGGSALHGDASSR